MDLIELTEPFLQVPRDTAMVDAVRMMAERKADVAAVVDDTRLLGIVTEKDLVERTAGAGGMDATTLPVGQFVTTVETVSLSTPIADAGRAMREHNLAFIALLDPNGTFAGIVSLRRVLMETVDELDLKVNNLERELMADGPGG